MELHRFSDKNKRCSFLIETIRKYTVFLFRGVFFTTRKNERCKVSNSLSVLVRIEKLTQKSTKRKKKIVFDEEEKTTQDTEKRRFEVDF